MSKIKFGTDGWRAIVGKDFNEENLTIAMQKANQAGAKTTQFLGAVEL